MNLTALRYFLEVARCLSIRRAAERLHVAASAISRQIAALEHQLGCTLLDRRADGVDLTAAGLLLKRHAQEMIAHIELARSDIDALKALRRGSLHIAAVEGITSTFLPAVLTEFTQRFPDVNLRVSVLSRDQIVDALDQYECDLGFVYDFSSHPAVEIAANYHQPLRAFVAQGHPLALGQKVSIGGLMAYDFVLPDPSFGIHQLVRRVMRIHRIAAEPKIVANNLHFLQRYGQSIGAVVFVPVQAVHDEIATGALVPVNLDCKEFEHRHMSMAVRRHRMLPFAATALSTVAREQFPLWEERDRKVMREAIERCWNSAVT